MISVYGNKSHVEANQKSAMMVLSIAPVGSGWNAVKGTQRTLRIYELKMDGQEPSKVHPKPEDTANHEYGRSHSSSWIKHNEMYLGGKNQEL